MGRVKVTDDYYIQAESSPICYTIQRRVVRTRKTDNTEYEDFVPLGYFGSLDGALNGLDNQIIADTVAGYSGGLTDCLAEIRAGREELAELIRRALQ